MKSFIGKKSGVPKIEILGSFFVDNQRKRVRGRVRAHTHVNLLNFFGVNHEALEGEYCY